MPVDQSHYRRREDKGSDLGARCTLETGEDVQKDQKRSKRKAYSLIILSRLEAELKQKREEADEWCDKYEEMRQNRDDWRKDSVKNLQDVRNSHNKFLLASKRANECRREAETRLQKLFAAEKKLKKIRKISGEARK